MSPRREEAVDPLVPPATAAPAGAADEDLDFEALLDASSLGAPQVTAVLGLTPEPVRQRIAEAAARPDPGETGRAEDRPVPPATAARPASAEVAPRREGAVARWQPARGPAVPLLFAHRSFLIHLAVPGTLGGTRYDRPPPGGLRSWRERDGEYEVLRADVLACLYEDPAAGALLRLTVRLTYRPCDPYAVEAVFRCGVDEVAWVFARELLAEGLRARAGAGDVSVWSDDADVRQDTRRTFIELRPPEGTALVALPSGEVAAFLDASERIVASGAEEEHLRRRLEELEEEFSQLTASPGSKD
ncbi:SsgA family sporulation/cell division regulator [Streptomyces antimicrobicus]|uniref:SsgA family sporulation/cell division regulator n=1 Tax=Streptomyces antimicrobicus TaxID=2883108 RepID=A0ABS8BDY8_9ACTN|nr:SsgA family sporulation/cell division regulator [Streptomyces antimicrobicus]MCB5182830.1 SsgA family sporulation/cell division regulator [Streptomyces antimicrobicus]